MVLYISYNGMTDSLGESQVLGYLKILSKSYKYALVSYEKAERKNDIPRISDICDEYGIDYYPLTYSRKPPVISTVKDIRTGIREAERIIEKNKCTIIHARGYISAMIASAVKKETNIPYIFDMRGWMIDERIESGRFDPIYYKPIITYLRKREKALIQNADRIVSLTETSKEILCQRFHVESNHISVIPTCADKNVFHYNKSDYITIRKELNIPTDAFVLIYSGSVGGYYSLDYMIFFYKCLLETVPGAYFVFLTQTPQEAILSQLEPAIMEKIRIKGVPFTEVSKYLNAADAGLIMYKDTFSSTGRSPTKLAEYWYCGLRVFAPHNVGDLNIFFSTATGGIQFEDYTCDSYRPAIKQFLNTAKDVHKDDIIQLAEHFFSVQEGARRYSRIYEDITVEQGGK